MRKKARLLLLTLSLALLLPLSSCAPVPKPSVETDLAYLTSAQCDGRLTGSAGNEKAQAHVEAQFSAAGLTHYGDAESYRIPYTQKVFDPTATNQTLTATFPNGTENAFHSGTDFYPWVYTEGGFSGAVTTDKDDPDIAEKVFLSAEWIGTDAAASVFLSDHHTAHINPWGMGPQGGELRISQTLFDALLGCTTLTLDSGLKAEDASVNNVVGVLKGKKSEDALFITAHLDHVGSSAGVTYPGAFDNASGATVLLETLRQMSQMDARPDFDVVFIAFNGEEMGQLGSKAFAGEGFPYKTVNVLNLDCLGDKGVDTIAVSSDGGALSDALVAYLAMQNAPCVQKNYGLSDHQSFLDAGIPTVNLSTDMDASTIKMHTPSDTADGLNPALLRQAASLVCGYAQTAPLVAMDTLPAPGDSSADFAEQTKEEALWAAARTLGEEAVKVYQPGENEMVAFEAEGEFFFAWREVPQVGLDAAQRAFPDLVIPPALGEFQFERMFSSTMKESVFIMRSPSIDGNESGDVVPKEGIPSGSSCILRYENIAGEAVILIVTPYDNDYLESDAEFFEYVTVNRGDQSFYQRFQHVNGERLPLAAIFLDPQHPSIYCIQSEDIFQSLAADVLTDLLADNLTAIKALH